MDREVDDVSAPSGSSSARPITKSACAAGIQVDMGFVLASALAERRSVSESMVRVPSQLWGRRSSSCAAQSGAATGEDASNGYVKLIGRPRKHCDADSQGCESLKSTAFATSWLDAAWLVPPG
jgi:hypothetical protein